MKAKLSLFAVIIALACLLVSCAPQTPEDVVGRYLTALQSGNVRAMARCLTPEDAEELHEYAEAYGIKAGGPQLYNMTPVEAPPPSFEGTVHSSSFEVTNVQIEDDTAWAAVEISYTSDDDSSSQEVLLKLERIDDCWYIAE